jgi:aminopeptidase YwaD
MKKVYTIVFIFIFFSCNKEVEIELATVKKHMNSLASDIQKGRSTFDIETMENVESYIVDVYKKHKLKAFPEYSNYLHSFEIKKFKILQDNSTLLANGSKIDFAAKSNINYEKKFKSISELKTVFTLHEINSNDDLNLAIDLSRNEGKHIVFIDQKHQPRFSGLKGYLNREKMEIGLKPESLVLFMIKPAKKLKSIHISVQIEKEVTVAKNTIAYLEGTDEKFKNEFVLLTAHHDHLGIKSNGTLDSIYNGADDNASGTTTVLAMVEYFSKLKMNKRSIIFSTLTAEEIGIIGSKELANNFPVELTNIVANLNFELFGNISQWGKGKLYMTGYDYSNLKEIIKDGIVDTNKFNIYPDPFPPSVNLFKRSDNISFARKGVVAHSLSSTDMNTVKTYHKENDDLEHINFENMTYLINQLAKSLNPLINNVKKAKYNEGLKID